MYFAFFVAVIMVYGITTWISSKSEMPPEVRKNLPPEDIELIHNELQARGHWGLLLILIAMFPIMFYLCLY